MQTHLLSLLKALPFYGAFFYALLNFTLAFGQAPTITTFSPTRNATSAPRTSNVSVTFSQAMNAATASNAAIKIQGSQTGTRTLAGKGSFSGSGTNTTTFDPAIDFKAGEQVSVSVTANAQNTGGTALAKPQVFNFTAASDPANAVFTKGSQASLANQSSYGDDPTSPCWADFDGDGDIDLAVNVGYNPDVITLLFNDGKGNLVIRDTPSPYSGRYTNNVRAADFDGDGDVDLAATGSEDDFMLLLNDGTGNFPTNLGGFATSFLVSYFNTGGKYFFDDFTTGDWDADGDVDIMTLVTINDNFGEEGYFQVVLTGINDGTGHFSESSSPYLFRTASNSGTNVLNGLLTGDWDNDGDLDVAIASNGQGITLLFNDGAGNYSGNTKLDLKGNQLQSGDFDKDGDLDLAVATSTGIAIRYNNGLGSFTGSGEIASESPTRFFTGDFNGDGTLDIAVVGQAKVTILLNNGSGVFTNHSSFPEIIFGYPLAGVADFDGDKDVDIASISVDPKYSNDIGIVTVWLNNSNTSNCTATGSILREYWANVPGHKIQDIPLNTPPTSTSQLTILRTAANDADNYGQRIRGYLCAPTTGNYTFFIQGDDQAELYLSSDSTAANKQRIASASLAWTWNLTASQQSAPISLVAGKRYYLEVLHKEGTGGDQVRVGWRTPGMAANAEPVVIPGTVLSPFTHLIPAPTSLDARTTQDYHIVVDWVDNASDETGYVVERATAETGPYTRIATLGPHDESIDPIVSYSDLPSETNTFYFYRVYATAASGTSAYSNVASVITYPCSATGTILREYWSNVPGSNISDIPLTTPPTSTSQLTVLRTAANIADHYAQRIRGYLCLEISGNYTFFIQGDDKAEIYLSTDNDPANKKRIASATLAWGWHVNASQQSAPISLEAGKRYYVEVLHKEGSGGDQVRVGWRTPDMEADAEPVVIPGDVLSPFVPTTSQPTNGLLACYAFSGNAKDGSGQGNNGTVNGPTLTTDRFGNPNSAYHFNGSSDYIDLPSGKLQPPSFSYSLWVKPTALPADQSYSVPFSIGSYGGDHNVVLINDYQGNPAISGWQLTSYSALGSASSVTTGSLPPINAWYHLVMTRDANNLRIYVNGTLAGSSASSGPSAYYGLETVAAYIGKRSSTSSQNFQGAIDDVQIYNRTLSAAEITTLYQQTGNPCSTTPAARLTEPTKEGLLSQLKAYPNPTTGLTTVAFTAAETGWLAVQLYNLQGQPLQQLFGKEVEAGSVHQRQYDATSLPSGLYLIRLVNGTRVEHHKLLVSH